MIFNVSVALLLMELNMFSVLNTILGFYANCAMAWVVTVAADIVINKGLLKISPTVPEFRRGMLYAINPVGFVSVILSAGLSIMVFFGLFGSWIEPFSPIVAIVLALVLTPLMAVLTKGKYYLRRTTTASTCRCSTPTATRRARRCAATSATRTTSART